MHTCGSCNSAYTLNTVESIIGEYLLEQSVSIRAVPEFIVGEAGAAVGFFGNGSFPFGIPVARQY